MLLRRSLSVSEPADVNDRPRIFLHSEQGFGEGLLS